jgi:alanine dehydrogenase
MFVGVPKEIKDNEYRVGLVPATVRELAARGHRVMVQKDAGNGAGIADSDYVAAGAEIVADAVEIFERAELIVKVKEPLKAERPLLKRGKILFTYLHLAADREQTEALMASGITAIAYETVTDAAGTLPLLTPMSEVAGRMAPQIGARLLEKTSGGRRAVGRCAGRHARRGADPGQRRGGNQRGGDRRGPRRGCDCGRPQCGVAAAFRRAIRRARVHRVLQHGNDRGALPAR